MKTRAFRRRLERGLFVAGVACLAWCGVAYARAAIYQRSANIQLDQMMASLRAPEAVSPPSGARPIVPEGELLGRIEIPRLRFSAAVAEGDDGGTLGVAVGHLPDTPLPWEQGNAALAGHRDTFFRPLKDIHVDDEIQFMTRRGTLRYRVRYTQIVSPEDVSVLAPTAIPRLTLITCYPFSYIGNAPQRFVVQADRLPAESQPALQ